MTQTMQDAFNIFLLCFIPLFVAMDGPGVLPIFLNFTSGLSERARRRLVTQATLTAFAVAVLFLATGKILFRVLGIDEHDFRIGGGVVLLFIAIGDLMVSNLDSRRVTTDSDFGVVPIGVPLIMGPAALTTSLILVEAHGTFMTSLALVVNLILIWLMFRHSNLVVRVLGKNGSRAFAKVAALFLAAIACKMIRMGVTGVVNAT